MNGSVHSVAKNHLENFLGTVASILKVLGAVRNFLTEKWLKASDEKIGGRPHMGHMENLICHSREENWGLHVAVLIRQLCG